MMTGQRHMAQNSPAINGAAAAPRISPSVQTVNRTNPSLSFHVTDAAARYFDVIVATDPALFNPDDAHRRTAMNFRSSRQDFAGAPIDIETGLYLLPRAFLRDALSASPRPERLYYLAVTYLDEGMGSGRLSVPSGQVEDAPHVTLAADIAVESLSKILGMAVDRLGRVDAAGRVLSALPVPGAAQLPAQIGGLPLNPNRPMPVPVPQPAHTAQPMPAPVQKPVAQPVVAPPVPAPNGNGQVAASDTANGHGPGNGMVANPSPVPEALPTPPDQDPAAGANGFVDEDYVFGGQGEEPATAMGFRDLDRNAFDDTYDDYDDGFGTPVASFAEAPDPAPNTGQPTGQPTDPIPELDPVEITPAPSNGTAAAPQPPEPAQPTPQPQATTPPAPAASVPANAGHEALVEAVITHGAGNRYEALNLDGAFRGRFGHSHPYYQRAHEGLRFGPHQVSQDSGELGELLSLMQQADPAGFTTHFGPQAQALIDTTNATGPSSIETEGGRSARVQPVEGKDLWDEHWAERFRKAAAHPPFQAAMRAHIIARRLEPMVPAAEALGLSDALGRAMVLALAIHLGVQPAIATLQSAINPFDTPAKLSAALQAVGHSELGSYRAVKGLPTAEGMDTATHFALVADLRALGAESPVQVPDPQAVMDQIVISVPPGAVGDALLKLRVSEAFETPVQEG